MRRPASPRRPRDSPPLARRMLAQPLVGGRGRLQGLHRKAHRRAVVHREEEEPQHVRLHDLQHVGQGGVVVGGVGHLFALGLQQPGVQPMGHEGRLPAAGFGLRDLVFVMRKDQVGAAAVNVDLVAERRLDHGGALDVPAGAPASPGTVPADLVVRGELPEGEVPRVALLRVHLHAGAGLDAQVLRASGQAAVVGEVGHREVDALRGGIGDAAVDEMLHRRHDVGHGAGDRGVLVGMAHAQAVEHVEIGPRLLLGVFERVLPNGTRAVDDLVVDVGEVLQVPHLVAAVLQVAPDDVHVDEHEAVADVGRGLGRHAADVDAHRVVERREGALFSRARVGNVKRHRD